MLTPAEGQTVRRFYVGEKGDDTSHRSKSGLQLNNKKTIN